MKVLKWLRAAIAATVDRMAWKMLLRYWLFILLIASWLYVLPGVLLPLMFVVFVVAVPAGWGFFLARAAWLNITRLAVVKEGSDVKVLKWLRAAMLRRLEYWIELIAPGWWLELIAPGWWLDKEGLYVKVLKWLRAAIAATVDRMAWKMLRRLESWPFVLLIAPGWWLDDVAVELFWNLLDPSYDLVLFTTVMPQGDILLGGGCTVLGRSLGPSVGVVRSPWCTFTFYVPRLRRRCSSVHCDLLDFGGGGLHAEYSVRGGHLPGPRVAGAGEYLDDHSRLFLPDFGGGFGLN